MQEDSPITFRQAGPRAAAGYVLNSLAIVARLAGEQAESDVLLGEAFARLSAAGDEAGVAQTFAAIGRLATLQGDRSGRSGRWRRASACAAASATSAASD